MILQRPVPKEEVLVWLALDRLLMQLFNLTFPAPLSMLSTAGKLKEKVRRLTAAPGCFPTVTAAREANFRPEMICSRYKVSDNDIPVQI